MVRPARPRQHSPAPYQAEECAVSTLSRAGAAPSLSRDPDTRCRMLPSPHQATGGGDTSASQQRDPTPRFPEHWERGRPKLQQLHSPPPPPPPAVMLRVPATGDHRLRECRLGHLTRIEIGVKRGGGNPRMSQPVPEKGARSQRCVAGDDNVDSTPRVPSFIPRPIPGLGWKRRRLDYLLLFLPSETKQCSGKGDQKRGATQGN